jgi:hypothetical protein
LPGKYPKIVALPGKSVINFENIRAPNRHVLVAR